MKTPAGSQPFSSAGSGNTLPAANQLYYEYVFDGKTGAQNFWGPIPSNVQEAVSISLPLLEVYRTEKQPLFTIDRLDELRKIITKIHRKYDTLTSRVKQNLNLISSQPMVIEAGHQPALLGGPGFVINKLAAISQFAKDPNAIPMMFVGDHDHEQKELTVIHLPSPGPRGIMFSYTLPKSFQHSPLHVLPLPPKSWLDQVTTKIQSTYRELVATAARSKKALYTERATRITKLLEETHNKASSMSDWVIRLWMRIVNSSRDSGILFQVFSTPAIRTLMLPAFEELLRPPIRKQYINALNQAREALQKLGYQPSIGRRPPDYVPFYLECPSPNCNRTRLDPTLTESQKKIMVEISATCPKCKETHSIEVTKAHPDLSPWEQFLSPRVDTRAFLVQSYTPITLHVGGAGETNYHAQVAPALKAIKSIVPIFFRYTRIFYANPWTGHLANRLQEEGLEPLLSRRLKEYHSAIQTGHEEKNAGVVRCLYAATGEYIRTTAQQAIQIETEIENKRNEAVIEQRETTDPRKRQTIQKEVGRLTRQRQLIQTYLSQMFGRFSRERFGQEVSFAWIDMAMSLDSRFLFDQLGKQYQALTPASATNYLEEMHDAIES